MKLAQRAFVEFSIASSKEKIEGLVMQAAKDRLRFIEMPLLPCQTEHVARLVEWMKSEGLKVEHKKWMDKPRGIASSMMDDDEEVEYSKYIITF